MTPAASNGLVERDVVRVVTPGTVLEPSLLDQKANNYLAAVTVESNQAGLAYVDITTGEFATTQLSTDELPLELGRLSPAELLVPEGEDVWESHASPPPVELGGYTITPFAPSAFEYENSRQAILDHFGVVTLEPFGCANLPLAVGAAGAVVEYLGQTRRSSPRGTGRPEHVLYRRVYDPGQPDPPEPGAFPRRTVGQRRPFPVFHPGPDKDTDGGSSPQTVAGPAFAGH